MIDLRKHYIKILFLAGVILLILSSIWIIVNLNSNSELTTTIKMLNDDNYYSGVGEAVRNSKEYIHIVVFGGTYQEDTDVEKLFDDLEAAAERGVTVKIVFDEGWEKITYTAVELKSRGADVRFDNKERTTHAKFIVIDGEIVIIGSTNWSEAAMQKNHEANVLIHSTELAKDYEDYFEDIWDGN